MTQSSALKYSNIYLIPSKLQGIFLPILIKAVYYLLQHGSITLHILWLLKKITAWSKLLTKTLKKSDLISKKNSTSGAKVTRQNTYTSFKNHESSLLGK